ncbi:Rz-like spanin [Pseudomonas phage vB_PpuP-IPa-2]
MKTIAIYVLAALLILGGSVGLYKQHAELAATKVQLNEQKLAIDALRAKQAAIGAAVTKATATANAARTSVTQALGKEPAFRDTPVPDSVRTGLCSTIRCSK